MPHGMRTPGAPKPATTPATVNFALPTYPTAAQVRGRGAGSVSQQGSDPKPTPKPTGSVVRIGDREYDMNNPQDVADLEAFQAAEAQRQPPMADIRGGDGVQSDGSRSPAPTRAPAPTPAPTPVGPQPATVALPLLDLDGINEHLTTILGKGPNWDYTGNTSLRELGGTPTETVVEGTAATPEQANSDADTADNTRAVSIPGEEEPTNWAVRQSDASRRAFLDHPGGSLAGTRAALAERGLYSQGNQYFTNIGGEAVEISRDDYNGLRLGNIDAQTFKDNYQSQVQSTLEPGDPENETADLTTSGYTPEESQAILSDDGLETVIEPDEQEEK